MACTAGLTFKYLDFSLLGIYPIRKQPIQVLVVGYSCMYCRYRTDIMMYVSFEQTRASKFQHYNCIAHIIPTYVKL